MRHCRISASRLFLVPLLLCLGETLGLSRTEKIQMLAKENPRYAAALLQLQSETEIVQMTSSSLHLARAVLKRKNRVRNTSASGVAKVVSGSTSDRALVLGHDSDISAAPQKEGGCYCNPTDDLEVTSYWGLCYEFKKTPKNANSIIFDKCKTYDCNPRFECDEENGEYWCLKMKKTAVMYPFFYHGGIEMCLRYFTHTTSVVPYSYEKVYRPVADKSPLAKSILAAARAQVALAREENLDNMGTPS